MRTSRKECKEKNLPEPTPMTRTEEILDTLIKGISKVQDEE